MTVSFKSIASGELLWRTERDKDRDAAVALFGLTRRSCPQRVKRSLACAKGVPRTTICRKFVVHPEQLHLSLIGGRRDCRDRYPGRNPADAAVVMPSSR